MRDFLVERTQGVPDRLRRLSSEVTGHMPVGLEGCKLHETSIAFEEHLCRLIVITLHVRKVKLEHS